MKVREEKCPICGHKSMWIETGVGGLTEEYYLKDSGKQLSVSICSACEVLVILLPNQLEGILSDDERIVIRGIRGI